ncbi:MAG: ABC transporter permease subunit, partial [Pseudomonadota bacterium]
MADLTVTRSGRRFLAVPTNALNVVVLAIVVVLIAAPLLKITLVTLAPETIRAWQDVLSSRLSPNLFYKPLTNTLVIGASVAIGCVLIGGFLAWLVVMTDVPFRRTIAVLSTLPFMIPSFAAALAWGVLFRNDRVGGQIGYLEGLGFDVPDWLAWGMVPSLIVLVMHYFSLTFTVIAAALATVNSDLVEAAELTGARRSQIFFGIVLPVSLPALIAGASLSFAGGVSNFAVPALLGLPVRMQTLSTRIYGMIEVGQTARGYVIAILLVLISAVFLWLGNRMITGRRSYATITGKGSRAKRFSLEGLRWPLAALALFICVFSTIVPVLVLIASSFAPSSSALFSNWTLHFWLGPSSPSIAQGLAGIIHNPDIVSAIGITVGLGLTVA